MASLSDTQFPSGSVLLANMEFLYDASCQSRESLLSRILFLWDISVPSNWGFFPERQRWRPTCAFNNRPTCQHPGYCLEIHFSSSGVESWRSSPAARSLKQFFFFAEKNAMTFLFAFFVPIVRLGRGILNTIPGWQPETRLQAVPQQNGEQFSLAFRTAPSLFIHKCRTQMSDKL